MACERVFVYGTLRRGGSRPIPKLFADAEFLGFGTLRGILYDFGAYPGFVPDAAGGWVRGEVYRVGHEALARMDAIEAWNPRDIAGSYYWRKLHTIRMDDGHHLEAWVYECNPNRFDLSTLIAGGGRYDVIFWTEHFEKGMGEVLARVQTPHPVDLAAIPRFNESEGHGPKRAHPVSAYFDDLSRHLMWEIYRKDFQLFGYDFDDPDHKEPKRPIDLDEVHAKLAS